MRFFILCGAYLIGWCIRPTWIVEIKVAPRWFLLGLFIAALWMDIAEFRSRPRS